MSDDLSIEDIFNLDYLRTMLKSREGEAKFAHLGLGEVRLTENMFELLPALIAKHLRTKGLTPSKRINVRLIVDPVSIFRLGSDVKQDLMILLEASYQARLVVLDDGQPHLHADEAILQRALQAIIGADCIVSLGGGTITDIAKFAAHHANIPVHIVVQTAASVDGYTDNFSVVLQNGVKTTLTTRWPDAVVVDSCLIAAVPHHLNAAGFGELMSMYCAPGDWFLAAKLGMDRNYIPALLDFLAPCGKDIEIWSSDFGRRDGQACAHLTKALALRGIVTGIGGTTAPLSGMEHLFSHMLDMIHGHDHEPMGLHGQQVGVGSLIRGVAWDFFCEKMQENIPSQTRLFTPIASFESRVRDAFATLDPTGRLGDECWLRYRKKLILWHEAKDKVLAFFQNWEKYRQEHNRLTRDAGTIAHYMRQAQAVMHYHQLTPSLSREWLHFVVANCQFMRERFTIADLLTLTGWWHGEHVAQVLDRVDELCHDAGGSMK